MLVNWAQETLLLGSDVALGGTYCIEFLTLFGCQGFDPVSAFRVCLVHQARTQRERVGLLVCFLAPNIHRILPIC